MLQISLINDNTNINPRHKTKKKKNQNPYNQKLAPLIVLDLKVEPNQ